MPNKSDKIQDLAITEAIEGKIFFIRGERVMMDSDLAQVYRVETKELKQALRRNRHRFPDDFLFELTIDN